MMKLLSTLLPLVLLATSPSIANAALYDNVSQLPKLSFDYVIVGAGTAGNTIAARLTEDPNIQVLVLEAGVSDRGILAATVPQLSPTLTPNTMYSWNYTITPQPSLEGRVMAYPHGRLLGGDSSINYMTYTRGAADDFNKYAEVSGDPGWGWDHLRSYITRHERIVPPTNGRDMTGLFEASVYGTTGAVAVNPIPNDISEFDERVIDASRELGEFAFNPDMNTGNVLGVGYAQSSSGGGRHVSSATAYLHPNIERPNLHVLINAQVTKLMKTGERNGLPVFGGVRFQSNADAPQITVQAQSEVILSAGSMGTPRLLQLSGIGDSVDLSSIGINTIVDLPSVGKNLSDHLGVLTYYKVKGKSLDALFRDPEAFQAALEQWELHKTGPLSNAAGDTIVWARVAPDHSIFKHTPDPSAGPGSAHYELLPVNLCLKGGIVPPPGNYMSVFSVLSSPTSRGTVKLASKDPWALPLINPNFLSSDFDRVVLREALKAAQRLTTASVWKDWIEAPYGETVNLTSDDKIDEYIRKKAITINHQVGTASMSPHGANWGVVDPDLKVKGTEGLRIVDASVIPFVPSAHPQAPLYLIAERAAEVIKASYRGTVQRPGDEL